MPYRIDPKGHDRRVELLHRAIQSATSDRAAGREYVPQEWIDEATAFLAGYRPKVAAITRQIGARSIQIGERDAAISRLSTHVRHGWRALRMRVDRLEQPKGLLRIYGLPLKGVSLRSARPDEWLSYARQFIDGDAVAASRNHEPMCNPSAAEIEAVLAVASARVDAVSAADAGVDDAQAAAAADAPRADELIADLVDYLEFSLRKMDGPSQRRIMRRYGIRFYYFAGEKPDPDDVDAVGD